jgi:hypothetical protein
MVLRFWRDSKICPQCKCEPRDCQVLRDARPTMVRCLLLKHCNKAWKHCLFDTQRTVDSTRSNVKTHGNGNIYQWFACRLRSSSTGFDHDTGCR